MVDTHSNDPYLSLLPPDTAHDYSHADPSTDLGPEIRLARSQVAAALRNADDPDRPARTQITLWLDILIKLCRADKPDPTPSDLEQLLIDAARDITHPTTTPLPNDSKESREP